ncbi:hypothetical protein EG329_006766 [Mollisiaceae sp. DMI_Dod_QoI]|nr:hypothetical protein EG329_006766 [Helotiales sp. DMI_Dod_QoI]
MKALSDFLMTREPPPNNWVSIQSSDDDESLSPLKKSAYKLLGKSKKKKSKTPRLMQLPDSAVAAKTTKGARHIAISIPLVYDHQELMRPPTPIARHQNMPGDRERTDRTVVHVLKPLTEGRESVSSRTTSLPKSRNGPVEVGDDRPETAINNPLAIIPPPEVFRQSPGIGSSSGTYLDSRPEPRIEPRNSPRLDPGRLQKSYVAVSPTAMQRQDSQHSDPRHSGGTMYSAISIGTPQPGHSRDPSSVSTAPSATATGAAVILGLKLDLPPRNSSISKVTKPIQAELAQTSKAVNEKLPEPPQSPFKSDSLGSGDSPSPPLVIVGTAETARKYNDGPQIVRSTTPRSQVSGPPNRSLPDLPNGVARSIARPSTAPPSQTQKTTTVSHLKESTTRRSSTRDRDAAGKLDPARQSRQERVKERKQRDIDALRSSTGSKTGNRAPLAESSNNNQREPITTPTATGSGGGIVTGRTSRLITPPRNPKRNGHISSAEKRKLQNTISPIMLVANLPPYTDFISLSDLPPPSEKENRHQSIGSGRTMDDRNRGNLPQS